ncbi:hypothetical protein BKA80DRAFT_43928 [Phyllosticta citrichinensis]
MISSLLALVVPGTTPPGRSLLLCEVVAGQFILHGISSRPVSQPCPLREVCQTPRCEVRQKDHNEGFICRP